MRVWGNPILAVPESSVVRSFVQYPLHSDRIPYTKIPSDNTMVYPIRHYPLHSVYRVLAFVRHPFN